MPRVGQALRRAIRSLRRALFASFPQVQFPPARLAELQAEYVQRWQRLFESATAHAAPAVADKRFAHETWHDNGPFTWTAAL